MTLETLMQLVDLARTFNESAYNGSLVLVVNGETYYPDLDSLDIGGEIRCEPGQARAGILCGEFVLD